MRAWRVLSLSVGVLFIAVGVAAHDIEDIRVGGGFVVDDGQGVGLASVHLTVSNAGDHAIQLVSATSTFGEMLHDEGVTALAAGENQAFGDDTLALLLPARADATAGDVFPLMLTFAMLNEDGASAEETLSVVTAVQVVDEAPNPHDVEVTNAYTLQTAAAQDADAMPTTPGAVYMMLTNTGAAPLSVVAVETDAAGVVELHQTVVDGGVGRMRAIDLLPLPVDKTIVLRPGGLHIMLIDMPRHLVAGEAFVITLRFDDGSHQTVPVAVVDPVTMGVDGAHDHSQHDHNDHTEHNH